MSAANANQSRRLRDAKLTKTKALPAAAATNNADSVDLGSTVLGPAGDEIELEINLPATPSLVDAKSITITVKDSADNVTFAAIVGVGTVVSLSAGGGAAALVRKLRLPAHTRRYLRVDAAVEAAGGDNTAVSYTYAVLANAG